MGPIKQAVSAAILGAGLIFPRAVIADDGSMHPASPTGPLNPAVSPAYQANPSLQQQLNARMRQIDEQIDDTQSIYGEIQRGGPVLSGAVAPENFQRDLAGFVDQANHLRAAAVAQTVDQRLVRSSERLADLCRSYARNLGAYRDFPRKYAELKLRLDQRLGESPEAAEKYCRSAAFLQAAEEAYQAGSPAEVRAALREAEKDLHMSVAGKLAMIAATAAAAVGAAARRLVREERF
jgi:hypothetical protein